MAACSFAESSDADIHIPFTVELLCYSTTIFATNKCSMSLKKFAEISSGGEATSSAFHISNELKPLCFNLSCCENEKFDLIYILVNYCVVQRPFS